MALEHLGGGAVPVVHAAAEAVAPFPAAGAAARPGPVAVAERLEALLPHFVEIILIDAALREPVPVDVGTGRNAAVDEDGGDVDAGVNIASILIDGRISACPNIDRDRFSQGNIYEDNFYEVWEKRFQPFRRRGWARTGRCAGCKEWKNCLGNGMHNWHGPSAEVLQCHYAKMLGQ